jgi:hypothetical protein
MHIKCLSENPKGVRQLEKPVRRGESNIKLLSVLKIQSVGMWSGFIVLRIGPNGGPL